MKKLYLASQSPRRQQLMKDAGLEFEVINKEGIDEIFPQGLKKEQIAEHLAILKAEAYPEILETDAILITADTIVWQKGKVLGKPQNEEDAYEMLKSLSGKKHWVITGVCIRSKHKQVVFHSSTKVFFSDLAEDEIWFYIKNFKPFDKAGAYGIQEWIGHIGVKKISGSYFNVMGLPIQRLYQHLKEF